MCSSFSLLSGQGAGVTRTGSGFLSRVRGRELTWLIRYCCRPLSVQKRLVQGATGRGCRGVCFVHHRGRGGGGSRLTKTHNFAHKYNYIYVENVLFLVLEQDERGAGLDSRLHSLTRREHTTTLLTMFIFRYRGGGLSRCRLSFTKTDCASRSPGRLICRLGTYGSRWRTLYNSPLGIPGSYIVNM